MLRFIREHVCPTKAKPELPKVRQGIRVERIEAARIRGRIAQNNARVIAELRKVKRSGDDAA